MQPNSGRGFADRPEAAPSVFGRPPERRLAQVFHHDPDLLEGLDAGSADELRHRAVAPRVCLDAAVWQPPSDARPFRACLGLLVLDGFAVRSVTCEGRSYPEVLGPGDLVRPWETDASTQCIDHTATWRILQPTTLAVLDARFTAMVGRAPTVLAHLVSRATTRSSGLALSLAIAQIRSARTRLLLVLWGLAERWGHMTPAGAVVPVPLTHQTLAHLVCLQRPTASTALQQLRRDGLIDRRTDGCWVLREEPPTTTAAPAEARRAPSLAAA